MSFSNVKKILPAGLTSLNLFFGLGATLLCVVAQNAIGTAGRYYVLASWLIIAATMLDGLDGKLARATHTSSKFGIQFDSLADLVSFGFAPAVILYSRFLQDLPVWLVVVPMFYLLCTALRLARFNVTTDGGRKECFYGMPSPPAGGMVPAFVLFIDFLEKRQIVLAGPSQLSLIAVGIALVCACLMVTTIEFDVFGKFYFGPFSQLPARLVIVAVLATALFLFPGPTLLAMGTTFILKCVIRKLAHILVLHKRDSLDVDEQYHKFT